MLTKRTNILFKEDQWLSLVALAQEWGTSVAELVRQAVDEKYLQGKRDAEVKKAVETILRIRKKVPGINYKELINAGRKY